MKVVLMICGLLTLPALPVNGSAGLSLTVSPARSFAPATLRVRARIDRSVENRTFTVVAMGDEFYRSSSIQLDGEQSPVSVAIEFRSVPGGEYEVVGTLMDNSGHRRAAAYDWVSVIPVGGER